MHYIIELVLNKKGLAQDGRILGLTCPFTDEGPTYIHICHQDFEVAWDDTLNMQVINYGVHKFYGGGGEGRSFNLFESALLSSLYDEYQTNDRLKDGDTFECTYRGATYRFKCEGVHVTHNN